METQEMSVQEITSEFDPVDVTENKVMALLSYIGILVILPILMARESKFAMFHANQGLVLAIAGIAASILIGAVAWIPIIGLVALLLSFVIGVITLVLAVMGIVNSVQGRAKKLPIIGNIVLIK